MKCGSAMSNSVGSVRFASSFSLAAFASAPFSLVDREIVPSLSSGSREFKCGNSVTALSLSLSGSSSAGQLPLNSPRSEHHLYGKGSNDLTGVGLSPFVRRAWCIRLIRSKRRGRRTNGLRKLAIGVLYLVCQVLEGEPR